MSTKSPNPTDKHVGAKIRMQRMMLGMSQEALGNALGITFQQVQKYEKGSNRVSASRLMQISRALGISLSSLFEGAPGNDPQGVLPEGAASAASMAEFLGTSEGCALMGAFSRIANPAVRRRIADLVEALANQESNQQGVQ